MEKIIADKYALELSKIKRDNLEELYLIIKCSFENLIYYMKYKKTKSSVPKQCINVVKEFIKIIYEERKIVNFILNHISYIDEVNLSDFLEKLDTLNEQTINYFYIHLDDIEDAIELDDLRRINDNKKFKTLPENNDIKLNACNLIFSKEFIKSYLGYEEAFWKFVDARTIFSYDIKDYEMEWSYDLGEQIKLKLTLPVIKDLNTAIICMKAYNKVHILYINKNKQSMEHPEEKIKKYYANACNYLNVH